MESILQDFNIVTVETKESSVDTTMDGQIGNPPRRDSRLAKEDKDAIGCISYTPTQTAWLLRRRLLAAG